MGLDQYAYARSAELDRGEDGENNEELAYWRKHNRLHGWMEDLFRSKGNVVAEEGFGSSFNCVELELTESDLEQLEAHVENKSLPKTGGFFFGGDSYADYEGEYGYKETDLRFIVSAREALQEGKKVFYNSWW